jgi:Spy/CpxP family protein refolding chaperone
MIAKNVKGHEEDKPQITVKEVTTMKKKALLVGAILAVAALSASVSYADPQFPGRMGYRAWGPGCEGAWGPPALTEEQRSKWAEMQEEFLKETAPLRQEVRQKRLELAAIMAGPNPEEAQAIAKMKELSQAREKLAEKVIQFRIKNRDTLGELPEFHRGFGRGYGFHMGEEGYGRHKIPYGPRRGPEGFRGHPCWD